MKKLTVFVVLVLSTLFIFGCNQAQQKPAPPEQTLIPKESTIGFSQVEIDELPATIQKVASATEDRPMATWAHDNNNSYILLNTGQDDDENLKVSKVIQKVPVQNFLWLDVQLDYTDGTKAKDDSKRKIVAVKLDKTDKTIDGVGFEIKEASESDKEDPEEAKPQAAPTPTPAPTTREPVNQTRPAPENRQPAPTRETSPREEPTGDTQEENEEQPTPAAPNGD